MAWEIEGWQSGTGERFDGAPTEDQLLITDGVLVHSSDPNDPEGDEYFWVFHPDFFYDQETVDYLIGIALEGYGYDA